MVGNFLITPISFWFRCGNSHFFMHWYCLRFVRYINLWYELYRKQSSKMRQSFYANVTPIVTFFVELWRARQRPFAAMIGSGQCGFLKRKIGISFDTDIQTGWNFNTTIYLTLWGWTLGENLIPIHQVNRKLWLIQLLINIHLLLLLLLSRSFESCTEPICWNLDQMCIL